MLRVHPSDRAGECQNARPEESPVPVSNRQELPDHLEGPPAVRLRWVMTIGVRFAAPPRS
jgi:hypothetical protein